MKPIASNSIQIKYYANTIVIIKISGELSFIKISYLHLIISLDIKSKFKTMYNEFGIDITAATIEFLRKPIAVGGFPFDLRMEGPNKENHLLI